MSDYGKRGGTSATAGKKAVTYETALDATKQFRKRSFHITAEHASMALYKDLSGVIGVANEPHDDWGKDVIWVDCHRI